ncbi:MAG TPA: mechanosensitive ion channel family protein, partial [Allocoleopsis sp.]
MIQNILHQVAQLNPRGLILLSLLITFLGIGLLYVILFYILRPIFREFENDIAFVTLNVSGYPILVIIAIYSLKISLKFSLAKLIPENILTVIEHIITASMIIIVSYWAAQLFEQVFVYYLKEYTKKSEVMWDDVLLPILSAVVPVMIYMAGIAFVLTAFGVDLSGIWVALGGATFVLGFALQDILANFFSGIVLLIDTPFQFGDILLLEDGSIGMLKQIGIRVTEVYVFSNHCDVYIPNSVLQGQKITNLSRPTTFYSQSISIDIPSECELNESQKLIEE